MKESSVYLICIIALAAFFLNCTQYVSPLVIKTRQDMDNVVSTKGIPLSVDEHFIGGTTPRHTVQLFYKDGFYQFQTDGDKSYSVMTSSHTTSVGSIQQPIPAWFKAKYPGLKWEGIPTK